MKNNNLKENLTEENAQSLMSHYTTIAQKAMTMLQSKDPAEREQALKNLHDIKNQLVETVYALADKIGLPKEQIEKMVANPTAFLSPEAKESLEALTGSAQ